MFIRLPDGITILNSDHIIAIEKLNEDPWVVEITTTEHKYEFRDPVDKPKKTWEWLFEALVDVDYAKE